MRQTLLQDAATLSVSCASQRSVSVLWALKVTSTLDVGAFHGRRNQLRCPRLFLSAALTLPVNAAAGPQRPRVSGGQYRNVKFQFRLTVQILVNLTSKM